MTNFAGKLPAFAMLLVFGGQSMGIGANLPRPAASYDGRTQSGLPARLDYYPPETGPFLAFRIGEAPSPSKPAPTLGEEGQMLDRLLGRLVADHADLPRSIKFAPDTQALVAALDRRLLEAGANWDPKHGTPQHGRSVDVLTAELGQVLGASPIASAFEAHGYRLVLNGIGRIEMAAAGHGGNRVPVFISEMDILAIRKEADHGAIGK